MRISHDTLLKYFRRILVQSNEVKRIFADRFPYILIDEYQDTHIDVVAAIEDVIRFAKSNDRKFFAGFFGDKAQRIYYETSESVERIQAICSLKHVEKKHNRRSAGEIIDAANRIRNDSINQTSIFDDAKGGSCRFYLAGLSTSYDEIYEALEARCDYDFESEPPDVFMLSNKKVAEKAGFGSLYEIIQKSQYYKMHYDRLSSELMSRNERKLGKAPRALRNLIQLRRCLENGGERLSTLLPKDVIATSNAKDLQQMLECISGNSASDLKGYLDKLVESIDSCKTEGLGATTKRAFAKRVGIDSFDRFVLESFLSESLCFDGEDEEGEESGSVVQSLMELDLSIYDKWLEYLTQDNTSGSGFHTFHGTKGDEYDCVLAIAGNRYTDNPQSPRSYFDLFFEKYADPPSVLNEDELRQFRAAQNLLYVATTRARKHFSFVYQSDEKLSGSSKANIESIFGEIIEI